jgi:hypothetical protein
MVCRTLMVRSKEDLMSDLSTDSLLEAPSEAETDGASEPAPA